MNKKKNEKNVCKLTGAKCLRSVKENIDKL